MDFMGLNFKKLFGGGSVGGEEGGALSGFLRDFCFVRLWDGSGIVSGFFKDFVFTIFRILWSFRDFYEALSCFKDRFGIL